MGFCLFSNVAIAARYLQQRPRRRPHRDRRLRRPPRQRHAGLLRGRPERLFISLHQHPRTCYPGSGYEWEIGVGPGRGLHAQPPLPARLRRRRLPGGARAPRRPRARRVPAGGAADLRRLRRPPRGPAGPDEPERSRLRADDRACSSRSPSSTAAGESSARWKAGTTSAPSAAAWCGTSPRWQSDGNSPVTLKPPARRPTIQRPHSRLPPANKRAGGRSYSPRPPAHD